MNDFKFMINEKVRNKNLSMIGTIIDAKLTDGLGAVYLVKYEDGSVYGSLWSIENSLEKVEE